MDGFGVSFIGSTWNSLGVWDNGGRFDEISVSLKKKNMALGVSRRIDFWTDPEKAASFRTGTPSFF